MNKNFAIACGLALTVLTFSCKGKNEIDSSNADNSNVDEETLTSVDSASKDEAASEATLDMCNNFPKELVMKYNPDGKKLEIETVELIPGKHSPCKVKLFYGDRDYDFWEGQVGAWDPKTSDPLWQYDPKRNPNIYHEVTEFGEQAVFIAGTNQLLIKKDGLLYSIVPPSRRGNTTNSGKENKEIAFEIARHYKL